MNKDRIDKTQSAIYRQYSGTDGCGTYFGTAVGTSVGYVTVLYRWCSDTSGTMYLTCCVFSYCDATHCGTSFDTSTGS